MIDLSVLDEVVERNNSKLFDLSTRTKTQNAIYFVYDLLQSLGEGKTADKVKALHSVLEEKQAIQCVVDYYAMEFKEKIDEKSSEFMDLHNVPLAYTTLTDEEIPIQVNLDIPDMCFKTYIGDNESLVEIADTCLDELESMDFDMLIADWQGYIEEHMEEYV
jgi:hypothetical protein